MLTVAQTAALIAGTGVAIYVVGFIGLLWAIYRTITGGVNAALYAVSLIPRTVVAGLGVRIFFGFPLLVVSAIAVLMFLQRLLRNLILTTFPVTSEVIFHVGVRPWSVAVTISTLVVVGWAMWVVFTGRTFNLIAAPLWPATGGTKSTVLWWGLSYAIVLYGSGFLYQAFDPAFDPATGGIVPGISDLGVLTKGLVIIFVGFFLVGLVEAFSVSPRVQLPAVRIAGPTTAKGRLLDVCCQVYAHNALMRP